MNDLILKTTNLTIGYLSKKHENIIATNLNLTLKRGELTALIGANGIGKSTLLKTLTGIQKPLSGKIEVNKQNLNTYHLLDLAQKMSVVLTEKLPPSQLTVFEIVALGRQPYTNWIGKLSDLDVLHITKALQDTQIQHLQSLKHHELSDGQLQKVLIARALAQNTPVIILDEPTTHLDLQHKVSVFRLLKKLASENQKAILFSTHDIDLAIQVSDQMILMTPKNIQQDQPCNLIAQGAFDLLFNDKNIVFDQQKGKFILENI
ncbi:ABC transporter ATP-binding protein [Flavobacterium branchiophilum]|uniref:Probable ABC-type iron(III)-transport system, ATPase component n=1 Tax=Flavobacterium branchiophilum (strain FL-15) TaxID=1034807 RepID=G2YZU6_FLABF|nr:ABC transporter ATP-binding protein [Flavobacterium branchiophilum]CCB69199.1 Probable ABC-type iron(III)-transport system, ATPase component [Flavobacterium branchiophilum FL-15]